MVKAPRFNFSCLHVSFQFKSLVITAECLYSMINGDDLYKTYAEISRSTSPFSVWIFSKIYIYTFITLFIYVVLSLFIGIIGDTYERLKVCRIRTFALPSSCLNVTSGKIKRVVFILYLWFSQGRFENIFKQRH